MNRQFLRTAAGFGTISALALVMVACGGSSSSAPATPTNAAPSTPVIVGPTTAITLHPAFYNLSAVDPEGDPITFIVNGTPISGNTYQLNPTTAGATTLSVQARDNKSPAATSGTANLTVSVAANRAPQFLSQSVGQLTGSNNTIAWNTFQVTAQDPDTDDVNYSVTGTPTFEDNAGGTSGISGAIAINATTGLVNFTGTVPSGKTSVKATFTVQAVDRLPGTTTVLGATATQVVTLTYFNGNQAPVILTTSLPNLPTNHYIPVTQGASGFPVQASDPNNDAISWTMTSSVPGLVLSNATGLTTEIRSGAGFVPLTSTATPISVTLTALDARGLSVSKVFTITVVGDAKPTLNSSPYTETVSGVKFFDKSQVKDQITSRARFYNGGNFATPGAPFFYDGGINWISNYGGALYVTGESDHDVDPLATNFAWSSPFAGGTDVAVAGWSARTLFRDNEGDGINYTVDPRSVYVSSPMQPVGQPFTLTSVDSALPNVFPILDGYSPNGGTQQGVGEFPTIDAADGTMTWLPVLHERMDSWTGSDNFGDSDTFANPSIWSYTVMGFEKVWNPLTSSFIILNDPSQAGRIDYSIKVQPNNRPWIGPVLGIPGATALVLGNPGNPNNQVVPTTTLLIGGGPSAAPNFYGRPSIQEPESRRYNVGTGTFAGFDYAAPNTAKPALWRWLFARAGGDPSPAGLVFGTGFSPKDAQLYDPDITANPGSGHQDAVVATMGEVTHPAADQSGNWPAITAASVTFYNPWLNSSNAGKFEVSWGPNRLQYLIARVTASAAYSFPVEARDQYERIHDQALGINPIFGTVRFTNTRTRNIRDAAVETGAVRRGGAFTGSNFPGDPVVAAPTATRFTFTYLPFPSNGSGSGNERDLDSFLFSGDGPASGAQSSSGLYTAASWITLNATEAPRTGFHTGNPLNDEASTFNLPSYASVLEGSSSGSAREDLKQYNYTWINGSNPTNPVAVDNYAVGSWANHEVRAQVIPSNSPYLFSLYFDSVPGGYINKWPTEVQGSTDQIAIRNFFYPSIPAVVGPTGYWYNQSATAHGWVYNLYQGEIDMQNAAAGRAVALDPFGTSTLRWTYSWPTQVTQSNFGQTIGGVNNWKKGDVMQLAVPNQGANARYFFVGDGSINDPNAAAITGWGGRGISRDTDTDNVFGSAVLDPGNGMVSANNTPFHVASNSIWIYNNFSGVGTTGFLNTPNRTTFSPGASATRVPWGFGLKGYISLNIAGAFANTDPGHLATFPGSGAATPALIDTFAGDEVHFLWLRQDPKVPTAWGTWDASKMVGGGPYTATGGLTTVPGFTMLANTGNLTLPVDLGSDAQVSMAQGSVPGQNHASNVNMNTDASLYNSSILSIQGFARSQWGLLAPTVGYQPSGSTNVRLVNPSFDATATAGNRWNNQIGPFLTTTAASVSTDGGVRDSAIIYAVRRHTDEKGVANAELGLAGIEPGSPLLAQYFNIAGKTDPALDASTVAATQLSDLAVFPSCFQFYSPFTGNAAWAHVMEFKMNYYVGVRYPDSVNTGLLANTNTLWKVPASVVNVFPLGAAVTDPSCTNPNNTINPGNPIVRPVEFLRISDFELNSVPGDIRSTMDLVNSNVTNSANGAGSFNLTGGSGYLRSRSNLRLTWQASVNNQVIPSGYVIELYQLTGTAATTDQPILLGTVRAGHLGGRDAIQKVYLPSMHSFSGLDGTGQPNAATYFFRVQTVYNKGINFEKQPTKQSIPHASADYVSAPFVTQMN